ncbi:RNA polymerase sigma factor [Saccharothrix sp. Mg75]|uniref:RNA polymerase sigma factor n=1 Tax=Saccharothrix sp. Mg75 TaxID=3445357 RepID=UPI003EED2BB7
MTADAMNGTSSLLAARSSTPVDPPQDFTAFFRDEYASVVAFLRKAGFAHDVADEATAESMVAAYRSWDAITSNRRAWVRTAARRAAVRLKTAARDEARRLVEEGRGLVARDGAAAGDDAGQDLLAHLLGALPTRQRLVVAWHLDGFTSEEVATATGWSAGTVRSHLRHAKDRLRRLVEAARSEEVDR